MSSRFLVVMLFPLFVGLSVWADCSDVRLDEPGGPMENMPVYDQDDVGYCWAYTGAQLIDAYRFSHGDKDTSHLTSPILIGIAKMGLRNKNGSLVTEVSWIVKEYGSCNQSKVLQFLNGDRPDKLLEKYQKYADTNNNFWRSRTMIQKVKDYFSPPPSPARDQVACEMPGGLVDAKDLNEIMDHYFKDELIGYDDGHFLREVIQSACKNSTKDLKDLPNITSTDLLKEFPNKSTTSRGGMAVLGINKLLNQKNPQPVGIAYCANDYLKKYMSPLYMFGGIAKGEGNMDKCMKHSSVIIGQRMSGGRCQFLLRNSWGSDWCPPDAECKGGQAWVDGEDLGRNIWEISTMAL